MPQVVEIVAVAYRKLFEIAWTGNDAHTILYYTILVLLAREKAVILVTYYSLLYRPNWRLDNMAK